MKDYYKMIKQFRTLENEAYGYHINGEVLGMSCAEFETLVCDAADSIEELLYKDVVINKLKEALALMWFAYENKDGDCPHEFEKEAVKEAQEILGPWENCMQKYFGEAEKSEP